MKKGSNNINAWAAAVNAEMNAEISAIQECEGEVKRLRKALEEIRDTTHLGVLQLRAHAHRALTRRGS